MKEKNRSHPEDFSPYLDKDFADERYHEIENHLNSCHQCAEELKVWQRVDSLFHSPQLTIEVPPFQWHRIATCLEESTRFSARQRWVRSLFAHPSTGFWSIAVALVLIIAVMLGGLEYRRSQSNSEIRTRILASAGDATANPFQEYLALGMEKNPFDEFRYPQDKENPFSQR